jgi:YbbR domain-containing protein
VKRIWPFRHIGLKMLALGLAVLLWFVVSGQVIVERGLTIPLELQEFPPNLELQTKPPSTVDVRVRGGSDSLSRLSSADFAAVLDLHGARPGQRLYHLTPDQVRAPFGVEIVQIMPTTIALVFEGSATKQVPIVPAIEGRPAPGFVIGKIKTDPETVEIVGPESAVRRAAVAITEQFSVSGSRVPVGGTVTVGTLDSALRLKNSRSAVLSVEILPAPLERALHALPVRWRHLAPNLTAQFMPATVGVTVRGNREALGRIGPDDVRAYVDLSELGAGEYARPVHAESQGDVGITQVEPSTVEVRITRDKE